MKKRNPVFTFTLISLFMIALSLSCRGKSEKRPDNELFLYFNLFQQSLYFPERSFGDPLNVASELGMERIISEKYKGRLDGEARSKIREKLESDLKYLKPLYFQLKVLEQYQPEEEDFLEYYKQNRDEFTIPETRDIWYLFLSAHVSEEETEWETAEKKKSRALELLESGGIESLAAEFNSKQFFGDKCKQVEKVEKGRYSDQVEKIIYSLGEGETSDFIKTTKGYIKIKVKGISPESVKPFSEVKPSIVAKVVREVKQRILDNLKRNAFRKNNITYEWKIWDKKSKESRQEELKRLCGKLGIDDGISALFSNQDFEDAVLDLVLTKEFQELDEDSRKDYGIMKEFVENRLNSLEGLDLLANKMVSGPIPEEDLKTFYREVPNLFYQKGKIIARIATIKSEGRHKDWRLAKKRAEDAANEFHKKLQNGEDFAELAKRHSQDPLAKKGGLIGEVDEETSKMGAIFDINAFDLEEGGFTKPLYRYSKGDYIIIKADKVLREKRLLPFDEVRDKVEEEYRIRKKGETINELSEKYWGMAREKAMDDIDRDQTMINFAIRFIK